MPGFIVLLLSALSAAASVTSPLSPYAQSVVDYSPGVGFSPGYDIPTAALGEPSRVNPGMFGGPVDVFNPPFHPSQIVSIGAGGSLTLQFDAPILDVPANPFGIDLLVFGNNGFTITNGDFGGGGITDGSTFTFDPPGGSRLLVSADGLIFFELVPPAGSGIVIDGLFPTDGEGNFQMPVDPLLRREDFAGLDLPGLRALYDQSGGGTGFDLSWARTAEGAPANLTDVRFVRIEGLSGKIEIDGFAVVPEPSSALLLFLAGAALLICASSRLRRLRWARAEKPNALRPDQRRQRSMSLLIGLGLTVASALPGRSVTFVETFDRDPASAGWKISGHADLFAWDNSAAWLETTWDSSRSNSFFYRSLGTILTRDDDFDFEFKVRLSDITIGTTPGKPYTFQMSVGLLNLDHATRTNFLRGSGINNNSGVRNLVEFDYFPDSGFGATVAPTVVSTNNRFAFNHHHPLELTTGDWFHVLMEYRATNRALQTTITRNGEPFGLPPENRLPPLSLAGLQDFRVDTFAISSYNDEGQNPPEFAGSILAHAVLDDVKYSVPPPPVAVLKVLPEEGIVEVTGRAGWWYQSERSIDLANWVPTSLPTFNSNSVVLLSDTNLPLPATASYRVRATRP